MVDRTKVKGIYVTGPKAGSAGMEELIGLVDETELNAMVIDVKNDEGNVTFRLMNEEITQNIPVLDQISEMQAGVCYIRDIQALMQELKDHNIYTIARIVCFKDPILAAARPELALTKPDGKPVTDANGLAWVNPYRQCWRRCVQGRSCSAAVLWLPVQRPKRTRQTSGTASPMMPL